MRLGRAIGLSGSTQEVIAGFFAWLKELRSVCALPYTLQQMNIVPHERLIAVALKDACHANNPRPCREEDFRRLFNQLLTYFMEALAAQAEVSQHERSKRHA